MSPNENAIGLIDVIARSLREEAGQFSLQVSVRTIGYNSAVYGGGTGTSISVTGGGSGPVTGLSVSANSPTRLELSEFNRYAGNQLSSELSEAIQALEQIAAQLKQPAPDQSAIRKSLDFAASKMMPPVLIAAVEYGCRHLLGLTS